jgi:hypothetical protein
MSAASRWPLGGVLLVVMLATAPAALGASGEVQTGPAQPAPDHWLYGVSCTSTSACMAVGAVGSSSNGDAFAALAERWNGSSWSIQSIPSPAGAVDTWLYGLSCVSSTSCTAVGTTDGGPVAEHWDGSSWSIQSTPDGGHLVDVSCTSATACTAVGSYGTATLAERWDGSSWSIQSTPNPAGEQYSELIGVSCSSATACTAVGEYHNSSGAGGTLAESWDGSSWSIQSTPNPAGEQYNQLTGVSCFSPNACTAVGVSGGTLAERWDGSSWSIQSTPNPAVGSGGLNRVSCSSATACTAVGQYSSSAGMMLAEGWDGSSWSIQSVPSPTGVQGGELIGVSCLSTSTCTAVGLYDDSSGPVLALQETWDGTTWQVPGSDDGALSGIVTDASTHAPIQNVEIDVYNSIGAAVASTCTAADGTYTAPGLPADTYRVGFTTSLVSCTGSNYVTQFYDNQKSLANADPVAVTAGSTTPGIDAAMVSNAGQISGTVPPGATTPGIAAAPVPAPTPAPPTMPVITHLSESHKTFREANKLATITRAKSAPMGTTFSFALNAASTLKLRFTQSLAGRKVKGRCVARRKTDEHKRACKRTVVVGRLSDHASAGLHKLHFEGRVSPSKRLKPGRYRLVVTAIDGAGQSRARSISFAIVK